ncbi:MAG TPA: carboxypeptidase-like regulatory domain-containing protein, partial [archaeon]|nr:carboxypeptidase-like regulatory domain-containing protein [archaeon]
MAEGNPLKDLYFSIEDKYYDLLDSLDKAGVPVYSVTDAIESQGIPSMPVMLLLVLGAIAVPAALFLGANPLAPGAISLNVSVIDAAGKPVSEAFVSAAFGGEKLSFTTLEDGKASFSVPANTEVTLAAEKKGFEAFSLTFTTGSEAVSRDAVLVAVERMLKFTILNPDGTPGKMVIVAKHVDGTQTTHPCDGSCKVPFKEGAVYQTENGQLISVPESGDPAPVYLQQAPTTGTGTLIVSITDSVTKAPVPNAFVEARSANSGVLKSSTKGDSEGSAKLENLEATRVYVVVKADGYLSSNTFSAPVTIKAGEVQQLKVELEKASGTIVVTVVEGESKPLQGVTVSSNPVDDASNVSTYTTAADGKVTVPVDVQKKYKLILSKSGYKDFSVASADPGKAYTYKLEKLDSVDPAKVTRLSVSVTDNQGFAVPNATVALHTVQTVKGILQVSPSPFKPAASTDANGKAAFVGLPVGTDFIVKAAYAQFDANSEVIKFSSEGEQKSVTLKLKLTPIIVTAEVKAENGSVVSGAQLSFQDATGTLTALENTTGGDGKTTTVFLFEGQRGSFVVRASGYREVTTEPVTIASGGLYTITLKESDKIVSGESNGAQVVYRGVYKNCSDELPFSGSIASGQNYCLKFQAISKGSDGGSLGFAALGATNKFADYAHFVAFSSTSDFVPSIPTGGARGAVEWLVKGPESVYFGLEFKVKAGIEQGTEIPLSVKAWKKVGTSCFGETSTESSACDASSLTGAKELSPKIVIGTMDVQPVGCTPEAPFYATITDPSGQVKRLSNATDYSSDEFPTLLLGEEASIEVQVCNPGTSVVSGASFDFYHGTVSVLSGSNLVIKDQEQKTFTIKSYSLKNIGVATTTVEEKTGQSLNSFSKASGDIAVGGKLVFTAKVKAEKSAANAAWSVGLVKSSRYVTPPSFKEFNVESRAAGNFDVLITSPAEAQLGKENTIVVQTFINDKITTLPLADSGLALKASFLSAAGGKIEKTNWTEDFQKQQYSIKVTPQNEGSPIKVSGQFPGYGSVEKEIPITAENLAKVIPIGPQEPINVDELPTGGLTGPIAVIVKAAVEGSTGSIIGTPTWDSTAERPENIANNDTGGVRVEKLEVSKASFGSSDETAGAITGTLRIPKNSYPEDFKIRVTFQLKLTAATEASVITAEIPVSLFSPTIQPTPEGCLEITITPEGKATISETSGAYKDVEVTNKCQRELKDVNLNISTGFGNAGTIFSNSIFSNGQKNVVIGTLQHNTGQIVNLNVGYEPQAGQVGDGAANDVKITANGAYTLLGGKAIATNSKAFNAEFSSFACITNSFISPVSFPNRDRGTLAQTTFNVRNDCTEKVNVSISSFAETGIEQLSFNPSFFVLEAGKETQVNASLVLQPSFLLRDFKQKTIVFLSKPVSSFDSLAELPVEQLGLTPCFTTKTQASCAVVGEGSTGSQVDLLAASTACDFKDWEQYLCAFTGSTCTPLIEKTLVSSGNITQCGRPQIE